MEHSPPSLSSPPTDRSIIVAQLEKGRGAAHQLRELFVNGLLSPGDHQLEDSLSAAAAAVKLTDQIINSFSDCLSKLGEVEGGGGVNQNSPSADTAKSRRGCYKRRKTDQTRIVETSIFPEDGYGWRKYGNKSIMNSPYPRQYFKCSQKVDQNCQATRTVQKVSDKPSIFRTIYSGEHTCKTSLKVSQMLLDSSLRDQSESSLYLSFDQSNHSSTSAANIYDYSNSNNSHHHRPIHRYPIEANSFFSSPSSVLQNMGVVPSQEGGELGLKCLVRHLQDGQYQHGTIMNSTRPTMVVTNTPIEAHDQILMTMNTMSLVNSSPSSSIYNCPNPTMHLSNEMNIKNPFTSMTTIDDEYEDVLSIDGPFSCSTTSSHSLEMENFTMPTGKNHFHLFDEIFDVDFD